MYIYVYSLYVLCCTCKVSNYMYTLHALCTCQQSDMYSHVNIYVHVQCTVTMYCTCHQQSDMYSHVNICTCTMYSNYVLYMSSTKQHVQSCKYMYMYNVQ